MMIQGDLFAQLPETKPKDEIQEASFDVTDFKAWLTELLHFGGLKALDVEFALFIYELANQKNKANETSSHEKLAIAYLAADLSHVVGLGHTCLALKNWTWDERLPFHYYVRQSPHFAKLHQALKQVFEQIDWTLLCGKSSLIADASFQAQPLCLQNQRLYLMRHWLYEDQIAEKLTSLAHKVTFLPHQIQLHREMLDNLFARQYSYLFEALNHLPTSNQVHRQRLVCDMLDVVAEKTQQLDWEAIDHVLESAQQVKDLQALDKLIPISFCLNWQKVAAAVALSRNFAVISGGPGTGKTTTVAKLLAALVNEAVSTAKQNDISGHFTPSAIAVPKIKLAAPTGKAAARLTESIGSAIEKLPVSAEIKAAMSTQSSTLHKLLGMRPDSTQCQYNQHNPLHLDILVLDEASMIDLTLMNHIINALPQGAKLILLGDKDQLSSVEAGAVLGDICDVHERGYHDAAATILSELTGFEAGVLKIKPPRLTNNTSNISDCLCVLQKSYRFDKTSGIGQLAKAINSGDQKQLKHIWSSHQNIALYPFLNDVQKLSEQENYQLLIELVAKEYNSYCQALNHSQANTKTQTNSERMVRSIENNAKMVLDAFQKTRVLAAIREGDFGVYGLNLMIENKLRNHYGLPKNNDDLWYHGRPVMVTKNDAASHLNNGDIGICLRDEQYQENDSQIKPKLRVYFEMSDGSIKGILPSRMPEHETAFAMTVHKSQGSEFEHTILVLPPQFNPVLTRELVYTGVTRAKLMLSLFASLDVLSTAVQVKTSRMSGLTNKL